MYSNPWKVAFESAEISSFIGVAMDFINNAVKNS